MFGVGLGGWIYYQMMRRTGSNVKASWTAAIAAGLMGAFVIYSIFAWLFPATQL
jgi:hypothetical protein